MCSCVTHVGVFVLSKTQETLTGYHSTDVSFVELQYIHSPSPLYAYNAPDALQVSQLQSVWVHVWPPECHRKAATVL